MNHEHPDQPTSDDHVGTEPEHQPIHEHPQIWVGSWLDYNNGILHGQWIDAAREDADIWADIEAMLHASPTATRYGDVAEDWGIFDFDNFGSYQPGEAETVASVSRIARGIAEHGPAFAAWADLVDDAEQLADFSDAYLGELVDDAGHLDAARAAVPASLAGYVTIDTAALARDMQLNSEIQTWPRPDGGIWLFEGSR